MHQNGGGAGGSEQSTATRTRAHTEDGSHIKGEDALRQRIHTQTPATPSQ